MRRVCAAVATKGAGESWRLGCWFQSTAQRTTGSRSFHPPRTWRGAMTWPRRATRVEDAATLLVATPTSTAVLPPPTTTTRLP